MSSNPIHLPRIYGLLAEFERPEELVEAARSARGAGYRKMDAYTPFPIHGLSDALGFRGTKLPLVVLAGGLIGCATALGMQWFSATIRTTPGASSSPLNRTWKIWPFCGSSSSQKLTPFTS